MKHYSYTMIILLLSKISFASAANSCDGHDHHHTSKHLHIEENKDSSNSIHGHFHTMTHFDRVKQSNASKEYNELYTHSHLEADLELGKNLSVVTNITLEGHPADNHGGCSHSHKNAGCSHSHKNVNTQNKYLHRHQMQIEELKLVFKKRFFSIYAGKFNPVVGFDYHKFPGIYTYQSIESYSIKEKVGLGGVINYEHGSYMSQLDTSIFSADTSILSESILNSKGRNKKSYGGVGNTKNISSFSAAVSGFSLNTEGFYYRIGFAKQAKSLSEQYDETRLSKSLGYNYKISDSTTVIIAGEQMTVFHSNGRASNNYTYNTLALGLDYRKWNFSTGYTSKQNQNEIKTKSLNLSTGYKFSNAIKIDIGYKHDTKYKKFSDRLGLLVSYSHEL